ncbi:MAG: hypothetical protein IPP03_01125 [Dechloromonas sp.]|nr:hypothetical protein [Candidatus Dechloromonas phosphoritropha]MBP8787535.1 hypothetical protein [Azonexus sp.]
MSPLPRTTMTHDPDRLAPTMTADAQRQGATPIWPRSSSVAATGAPPVTAMRRARCATPCSPPGSTSGD